MTDHEVNIEAIVCKYYFCQFVWNAAVDGEVLNCYRVVGNAHNPSAVVVKKYTVTVGHFPP